jgi:hypothetical protein
MPEPVRNLLVTPGDKTRAASTVRVVTDADGLEAFPSEEAGQWPVTCAIMPHGGSADGDPIDLFPAESLPADVPEPTGFQVAHAPLGAPHSTGLSTPATTRVWFGIRMFAAAGVVALLATTGILAVAALRRLPTIATVQTPPGTRRPIAASQSTTYSVAENEAATPRADPTSDKPTSKPIARDQRRARVQISAARTRLPVDAPRRERFSPPPLRQIRPPTSKPVPVDQPATGITVAVSDPGASQAGPINQSVAAPVPPTTQRVPVLIPAGPDSALRSGGASLNSTPTISSARPSPEVTEADAIQSVLNGYRRAFNTLDAGAAETIWPTVDVKTLSKAFGQLAQQRFEFDACRIAVAGGQAVASCGGRAQYVPRIGSKNARVEARHWIFRLHKLNETWLIETVESQ